MIVVTGPGRSGTSLVASIYRTFGIDPGGIWHDKVRAGLEARDVVEVNRRIARDLGVRIPGRQLLPAEERLPPERVTHRVSRLYDTLTWRFRLFPSLERHQRVVESHRDEVRELSRSRQVVKDPRFCWTLSVWLAAGAPIEHVVICMRALDRTVDSRAQMPFAGRHSSERRTLLVGAGLLQFTLAEYGVPHTTIDYPETFRDPATLQALLPELDEVDPVEFEATVSGIVDLPSPTI